MNFWIKYILLLLCLSRIPATQAQDYHSLLKSLESGLAKHIHENGRNNLATARAYNKIAKLHFYQKSYKAALESFEAELSTHLSLKQKDEQLTEKIKAYYNCSSLHRLMGNYPRAHQLAEKALFWSIQHHGDLHTETIDAYKLLANISMFWKRPDLQLKYSNKALKSLRQLPALDSSKWVDLSLLKAIYFLKTGDYREGEKLLKQVKRIAQKIQLAPAIEAKLYTDLGVFHEYQDQNAEALSHYKQALAIRIETGGEKQISVAWLWDNMGIVFNKMDEYEQALEYFEKSYQLTASLLGPNHPRSLELLMHKATALSHINQEKAIELFQEQIKAFQKSLGVDCLEQILAIQKLGSLAHKAGNYKEAIARAERVEYIFNKNKTHSPLTAARHYCNQARYYEKNEEYQKALAYYQKSIELNRYGADYLNPTLCLKAATALLKIPRVDFSRSSLIEEMFLLIKNEYLKQQFSTDQQELLVEAKGFYEGALAYLYTQKAAETRNALAWDCMLLSKAIRFAEAINFQDLSEEMGLSAVQQKEVQIAWANERLYQKQWLAAEAAGNAKDIEQQYQWLQAATQKRKAIEAKLYQEYPQLVKALNSFKNKEELEVLQKTLSPKEAILNYFAGEHHYYRICLKKQNFTLEQISASTFEQLPQLLDILRGNPHDFPDTEVFFDLIWPISEALLPADSSLKGVDCLIISADGALNYLPFELLLTNKRTNRSYKELDYCIKKYAIAYQFQIQTAQKNKGSSLDKGFLGISPLYPKTIEIPGAVEELKGLQSFFKGDFHYNKTFSKTDFLQKAAHYPILHLAMHAKAEDQGQAFLLFSKEAVNSSEQLSMQELAGLNLPDCQLLVLSACETGLGHYEKGEGVMSLGRAFAENGVAAELISLWGLPDQTAKELLLSFYKNLNKGWTKDRALQEAKLEYLENAGRLSAQPTFWSALVLWGNREGIDLPKASFSRKCYYLWGILITLVIASIWLLGYYFPSRKR